MKACSKDLGFQINFFFEKNEKAVEQRIEHEKRIKLSGILTANDKKERKKDPFADGYTTVEHLVKQAKPVKKKKRDQEIKIGIILYNGKDSFVSGLAEDLQQALKKAGKEKNIRVLLPVEDACGKQQKQDGQMEYLMEQGCDVLVVNPVDTWSASKMIHRAKKEGVPLIFFNREPSDEDIHLWDRVYYVGTDGKKIGQMQGEILTEAFQREDMQVDKNQDGILQYILVEGEEGHRDSVRRTDDMQKQVKNNFPMEQIASISAEWNRELAKAHFLQVDDDEIELCEAVICNNDDMALGILDALKEKDVEPYPVLVGVNGSQEVLNEIQKGKFYGTVSQKSQEQIYTIVDLIWKLWKKEAPEGPQKIYLQGEKQTKMTKK